VGAFIVTDAGPLWLGGVPGLSRNKFAIAEFKISRSNHPNLSALSQGTYEFSGGLSAGA
jgi:hypothetical protein